MAPARAPVHAAPVHAAPVHAAHATRAPALPLARPIGALIPAITRPAFRRRAPAGAQIFADWALIAGPSLARAAEPRRLSAGTLTLACSGPVAMELSHLGPQLIQRINTHLGQALVARLRFVQETLSSAPRPRPPARPDPARLAALPGRLAGLPEGGLKEALAALGRSLLEEEASRLAAPAKRPLDSNP